MTAPYLAMSGQIGACVVAAGATAGSVTEAAIGPTRAAMRRRPAARTRPRATEVIAHAPRRRHTAVQIAVVRRGVAANIGGPGMLAPRRGVPRAGEAATGGRR